MDTRVQTIQRRAHKALETSEEQCFVMQTEVTERARQQIILPPLWNITRTSEPLRLPRLLTMTTTCCDAGIEEESQQASSSSTVDTLRPSCSRWEVVGQRTQATTQEKETTGTCTSTGTGTELKQQDGQTALQAHPELLNSIPPEHAYALFHGDEPERQLAFINHKVPHLVPKLTGSDAQGLYQQFKASYVIKINEIADMIKNCMFVTKEEGIIVFDHFLRSFLPGWTLHKGKTTRNSDGVEKTVLTCHTVNHRTQSRSKRCKWRAVLQQVETGEYCFTEISDFGKHKEDCVKHFAHFTTDEVNYQMCFGPSGRPKVMEYLHQN